MASSLFALLDDIATLLDDVAVMTKVAARQGMAAADDVSAMTGLAAKKTAGVLGDDLALNAQQVTGVNADRELPVVWAVAKGSLLNKAILVPAALAISAVAPWAITPLLMLGGLFLCFEGAEKLLHAFFHKKSEDDAHHAELVKAVNDEKVDLVAFEKEKVKGKVIYHNYGYGGGGISIAYGGSLKLIENEFLPEGVSLDEELCVLGSGVVGLTTAYLLVQKGYKVNLYGNLMPFQQEKGEPQLTSTVAAGYWMPLKVANCKNEATDSWKHFIEML